MFQPVTPNIPGWAEPIEPGLGELYSGCDEEPIWLPSQFAKREQSHGIWERQVTPHPLLVSRRAVDVSKRPTPPSRPVSEYDYWDSRRRFCQRAFNSDGKKFHRGFLWGRLAAGCKHEILFHPGGSASSTGDLRLDTHFQSKLHVTLIGPHKAVGLVYGSSSSLGVDFFWRVGLKGF